MYSGIEEKPGHTTYPEPKSTDVVLLAKNTGHWCSGIITNQVSIAQEPQQNLLWFPYL